MSFFLVSVLATTNAAFALTPRDGAHRIHHAHHHGAPLLELNETEVAMYHSPTPLSYWSIDIDVIDPDAARHPSLMVLHVLFTSLAFFVALPMSKFCLPVSPYSHILTIPSDRYALCKAPVAWLRRTRFLHSSCPWLYRRLGVL
jgi:hypothetical protein